MTVKINSLQHVGIPVGDLAASEAFYKRLGFEKAMQATFPHGNGEGKVAMMQLGSIIIELYQLPDAELAGVTARKDGHIDHIAFDVDNIDIAFAALSSAGFAIVESEPAFLNFWTKGCKYFYIIGPDGERLEFCQIL